MPKAFSEVPKRIYSAGRKEISRLRNQRKELLLNLKDLKDKNRLLIKERRFMNRLLREYQGEEEPYAVLMKEHHDGIKSMKNALSNLRQEFYEEQMYHGKVDAQILSCNNQLGRCKELLERGKKTESMGILMEKLDASRQKANDLEQKIEVHRARISELTDRCREESRREEAELKRLQEKLRSDSEKLARFKSDFGLLTKKMNNGNHHHHHQEGNDAKECKPIIHVSNPDGQPSQPIGKKIRAKVPSRNRDVTKSLNLSFDQTSTLDRSETGKKQIPESSKHQLISPTVGVSYEDPQTSLKTCEDVTSDLGRSVETSADGVREVALNEQGAIQDPTPKDDDKRMDLLLSGCTDRRKTPCLFVDDGTEEEDCLSSRTGTITDSGKADDKVTDRSDDMVKCFTGLNISKDLDTDKPIDLAPRNGQAKHRKCCSGHKVRTSENEHQFRPRKKNLMFQTKAKPRKVYVFDKTVEHLHRGRPTKVQRA